MLLHYGVLQRWLEQQHKGSGLLPVLLTVAVSKITATVTLSEPLCTDFFFQCDSREGAS